ncbi:hypothetical protein [Marinicella sp. W31]|uniref:hypothetical protein n=1 Tax=Marinicella sp. W31 TaxID=3023713 RepID=UPI0037569B43
MNQIKASYALDVAQQMSLVGVFLGGISVTLLITLVVFNSPLKLANWIIGISALAGCSLLISVVASLRLIIALHPEFPSPETISSSEIGLLWRSMVAGYGLGVLSLVISIGLSGWLRSRSTGIMTTGVSMITIVFFMYTSIFN